MTREEFIEKNNLRVEYKAIADKTGELLSGTNVKLFLKQEILLKQVKKFMNLGMMQTELMDGMVNRKQKEK